MSRSRWRPRSGGGLRSTCSAPTMTPLTAPCIRLRSGARAFGCARLSARRRLGGVRLRLRTRLLGARGDRDGQARVRCRFQGRVRRPAGGRPGQDRRRLGSHPLGAGVAAAVRRSANHRPPCAGLGAQARNQESVISNQWSERHQSSIADH
jgi:hypothetical protein